MTRSTAEQNRQQREHARAVACMRAHRDSWWVSVRFGNASAFNGYRWQRSDYSEVRCAAAGCGRIWRTKAAYVSGLPDAPPS